MEKYTYTYILLHRERRIIVTMCTIQEVGPGFRDISVIFDPFVHSLSFLSKQDRNNLTLVPNNTERAHRLGQ